MSHLFGSLNWLLQTKVTTSFVVQSLHSLRTDPGTAQITLTQTFANIASVSSCVYKIRT